MLIIVSLLLSCWDTVLSCVPADCTREIKGNIVSIYLLFGYMTHIDSERANNRERDEGKAEHKALEHE